LEIQIICRVKRQVGIRRYCLIVSDLQDSATAVGDALLRQLTDMQQRLDSLRDQLTESQRLATIGTIAAVIAHEFNNLLTPIVSYSQFALQSANTETPDM
jgi:C4-dicarboxylate-specific signal transduction histidine kinase